MDQGECVISVCVCVCIIYKCAARSTQVSAPLLVYKRGDICARVSVCVYASKYEPMQERALPFLPYFCALLYMYILDVVSVYCIYCIVLRMDICVHK